MSIFSSEQKIGDIVAREPRAAEVFKRNKVDFCCGGNRPLAEAIREQGLNEAEILRQLEAVHREIPSQAKPQNFATMQPVELIDHIVETHHQYMWKALPELGELTLKILKVHGKNHEVLFKLHSLFGQLRMELEEHLIKEEEILFPMVKAYHHQPSAELGREIEDYIRDTEAEHEGAGDLLKAMRKLTDDYQVPPDACATFRLTYQKLEELESDLFQHIHLENNILFVKPVKH